MFLRFARCPGTAAALAGLVTALALAVSQPASAQSPAPADAAKPGGQPAEPQPVPEGLKTQAGDAFGAETALTAKPIVYVKGTGTWDQAFIIISGALKKVEAFVKDKGLKADGLPMTIFTATDDHGFDYEAAIPLAEPLKDPPRGEITAGQSPDGHALEFVHRGSYESLDDTYEAITNYLDDKKLDSRNILIEQYVTDPVSADEKNLVVNVLVLIK